MSWEPKRFDPPGYKGDGLEDEPEKCPKCSWAPWETFVWAATLYVAATILVLIVAWRHHH